MNYVFKVVLTICAVWSFNATYSQKQSNFGLPQIMPSAPQPTTFKQITPIQRPYRGLPNTPKINAEERSRYQRQMEMHERDVQQVAAMEMHKKEVQKGIYRDIGELFFYSLPTLATKEQTKYYKNAFDVLSQMDPNNFSVKKATFIIENAFFNNAKSEQNFDTTISNISAFIKADMRNKNSNLESNLAKNLAIYNFITDTTIVDGKRHLPYSYDFDDYMGRKDWNNMFVSKLLRDNKGQCNSMPRLFLILAEELQTEAYLGLAPNHSFIRFKDYLGEWRNAELTSGVMMTDWLMLTTGFIKSETIQNGNHLSSISKKQLMAMLLNDLASGYISKFGYDEFVQKIINKSLKLDPNGINTNLHESNIRRTRMRHVAQKLKIDSPIKLRSYPKAMKLYKELITQDKKLKSLGFTPIKPEDYKAWLESLEKEKDKQKDKIFEELKAQIKRN